MRRTLFLCIAMLAFCTSAKAETLGQRMASGNCECNPFYVSVSSGWTFLSDVEDGIFSADFNSGLNANVALGWQEKFGRVEFEYSKFDFDFDTVGFGPFRADADGSQSLDTWMVNAYIDVPVTSRLTGYAGAGLGVAQTSANSLATLAGTVSATSELGFAYQARAGISFDLTNRVELFSGYRFLGTETMTLQDSVLLVPFSDKLFVNEWESGIRLKF
ncbi:Surface antigen [Rosistilla carotiformis]|uniref:Surface antigen n=2 Tax=Rosistilla carotiformis TaxID=2528017 RepID=A0A518JQV4_9BACT|nr:Surface antigen [Rosistilla carotiformis]